MYVLTHYDDGRHASQSHELTMRQISYRGTLSFDESFPSYDFLYPINLTNKTTSYGRTYEHALNAFKEKLAMRIKEMQDFYDSLDTISPIEIDSCGQIIQKEAEINA